MSKSRVRVLRRQLEKANDRAECLANQLYMMKLIYGDQGRRSSEELGKMYSKLYEQAELAKKLSIEREALLDKVELLEEIVLYETTGVVSVEDEDQWWARRENVLYDLGALSRKALDGEESGFDIPF